MTVKDWIGIINALAWPFVALMALFYIWKSDAIAKLIQISDAVKDLKAKLAELVEVEQRLGDRSASVSEMVAVLRKASSDLARSRPTWRIFEILSRKKTNPRSWQAQAVQRENHRHQPSLRHLPPKSDFGTWNLPGATSC